MAQETPYTTDNALAYKGVGYYYEGPRIREKAEREASPLEQVEHESSKRTPFFGPMDFIQYK